MASAMITPLARAGWAIASPYVLQAAKKYAPLIGREAISVGRNIVQKVLQTGSLKQGIKSGLFDYIDKFINPKESAPAPEQKVSKAGIQALSNPFTVDVNEPKATIDEGLKTVALLNSGKINALSDNQVSNVKSTMNNFGGPSPVVRVIAQRPQGMEKELN